MSEPYLIAGYCPTLNRPALLARAIACWEQQTYSNRWLIILDDSSQFEHQRSDAGKWEIISLPRRIRSLGEKNNVAMALAPFDAFGYVKIDDDDVIAPWHVEAHADALSRAEIVQPRKCMDYFDGEWVVTKTHCPIRNTQASSLDVEFSYHAAWSMRRSLYEKMRGYSAEFAGDDVEFEKRRRALGIHSVGYDSEKYPPSYWYWSNFYKAHPEALCGSPVNISRRGGSKEVYMSTPVGPYVGKLKPYSGPPVWQMEVPENVIPRRW